MKSLLSLSLLVLLATSCGHHGHKGCEGGCKSGCSDKQCEMKGKKDGAKCHESEKNEEKTEAVEAKK